MSGQWVEVAQRGEVAIDVLSMARAIAEGYTLPPAAKLLCIIRPDDGVPFPCGFQSVERVKAWCETMQPHEVNVRVGEGEHEQGLRQMLGLTTWFH